MAQNVEDELVALHHENAALKEELSRLRLLFDGLPLGLYQVTPQGDVIVANSMAQEILGRNAEEIPVFASQFKEHAAGSASAAITAGLALERSDGHITETAGHDAGGQASHIRESIRAVQNPDGSTRYYECTLEDITERRQAEAALRSGEERYRLVVEHSPVGIVLVDDDCRIIYANPEVCRILGRRPDEVIGTQFKEHLHPDSIEFVTDCYRSRQKGESVPERYEIWAMHADNTPRLLALSAASFHTSGGAARTVAQVLDITDRTRVEQALRDYTRVLEVRNAELDAFADSVAHDLKNPLSTIIGFAEALLEALAELHDDDVRRILSSISAMGRKMDSIIEELLLFARIRQTAVQPRPINMRITVQNALDRLARMRVERDAQIEVPDQWPAAIGHGPWIEEVWANYISNALTYGGTPPKITLGSELTETGQVRFWVRDNGDGVDPGRQAQLFDEALGRNAAAAKGHGLGLSIVRRIVTKLGGEAAVESTGIPGEGSTFSFTLPAAEQVVLPEPVRE